MGRVIKSARLQAELTGVQDLAYFKEKTHSKMQITGGSISEHTATCRSTDCRKKAAMGPYWHFQ
eukprot:scaffold43527_cov13-Tisochrysis_lutea.AAC.1